eukprot:1362373-Pyramimonas_sp.AAC.1
MALRTPDERDLDPDRDPMRSGPGAPAGATAKATPKPKPEAIIDNPPSLDSSSPSLGPDQFRPKRKKRKSLDDPNPGDSKQQRYAGQPADRQRSRGPAVAAAAAAFQDTSTPTPKEPVPRRGPAPGRTHRTEWVPTLEGRTRDASSTRRGTEKLLTTSSKAPGMAPRDKTVSLTTSREGH